MNRIALLSFIISQQGRVSSFMLTSSKVAECGYKSHPRLRMTFTRIEEEEETLPTQEKGNFGNAKAETSAYYKDERKHGRSIPFPPFADEENSQISGDDIFQSLLENKSLVKTRLLKNRAYARPYQFALANATRAPMAADLEPPETKNNGFVSSWSNKVAVAAASFFAFPYISEFLSNLIGQASLNDLGKMAQIFVPGISIVYGTFISLTLSICFNRQTVLQRNVSEESALLSLLARYLLLLFRNREQDAIDACQCVADQVRLLVRGSRGSELLGLIYCDPYARIIEIVSEFEMEVTSSSRSDALQEQKESSVALISRVRDTCKDAIETRVLRLSDESLSLPPTHLQVLISLTSLMLLGFIISSVASSTSGSSIENGVVFSLLCSVYVVTYKYVEDLNDPFDGAYQVRRSSTACNLLQIKLLFCNHPLTKGKVDFDDVVLVNASAASKPEKGECVPCTTPGLGSRVFEIKDFE